MGKAQQESFLVHDPLGLLALPIASIGHDPCGNDGRRTGTNSAKLLDVDEVLEMAIAAKTIGGALVAGLIAVSLVALPGWLLWRATSITLSSGTNRNSASLSMNLRMSQG
jgi:hypothetical protein